MRSIVHFLNPYWSHTLSTLEEGISVMVYAPKNWGKSFFYDYLMRTKALSNTYHCVFLHLSSIDDENFFYQVWCSIMHQTNVSINNDARTKLGFVEALLSLTDRLNLLLVFKTHQHNVKAAARLIDAFQEIRIRQPQKFVNSILMLVLDDFSLYYYEYRFKDNSSPWDNFKRYYFRQLRQTAPIIQYFKAATLTLACKQRYAEAVLRITGGHEGLILNLLPLMENVDEEIATVDLELQIREHLMVSGVIDSLRRLLFTRSIEYLAKTLAYAHKRLSENYEDPQIIELHQLGLILKVDVSYSILCPGLLGELVKEIYDTKEAMHPTTIADSVSVKPLKFLYVAAIPDDKHRIVLEFDEIREKFSSTDNEILLSSPIVQANYERLLVTLRRERPHIIHYSGHGEQGGLCFRNQVTGKTQFIENEELLRVLNDYRSDLRLIFLDACNTTEAARLLSGLGIYVLGFNAEIDDTVARAFAEKFYFGFTFQTSPINIEKAIYIGCTNFLKTYPDHREFITLWKDGNEISYSTFK